MVKARDIYRSIGYKNWENFRRLVEKAEQLINNGAEQGIILKTDRCVRTGKGATRRILDYDLDEGAVNVIERMSSYNLNKAIGIQNEAVMLTLVKKYCDLKQINFDFQTVVGTYKYDCCVNQNILIEFDEQYHTTKRQKTIDKNKDTVAALSGYKIIRFNIFNDIIDIIDALDRLIDNKMIRVVNC